MADHNEGVAVLGSAPAVDAMAEGMAAKFAGRALEVARRQLAAAQDGASMATWRSIIARLEHLHR
ncbi:hypothetical protein HZF05_01110 [Sphingomonas sp. CGMCC 1.13654]|uniref:Uncharacterized protein n=1 Tax=Sphingomonas chungangi TaxID=2683589 RepID=A0A838L2D1_9SPHN|nr:hypothetical protein [Sphingomonas chungangi]MBA2932682.1 hypothetical protein [Sphingomonas chungangi]MVW56304.1 hypothetical protein [Sphingomonas chungangi]